MGLTVLVYSTMTDLLLDLDTAFLYFECAVVTKPGMLQILGLKL